MKNTTFVSITALILITMACNAPTPSEKPTNPEDVSSVEETISLPKTLDWQGHRGTRGLAPENTIPAFIKALEYPITTLELDVVVSKDNQLIVSHEPWFNHEICSHKDGSDMTSEEGHALHIYDMTYEEIKLYDCGSKVNPKYPKQKLVKTHKPSLEDVVNAVSVHCQSINIKVPYYNIELKSEEEGYYDILTPQPAEFVSLALKEIERLGLKGKCNLQSFDLNVLNEINKQSPETEVAYLVMNRDSTDQNLAKINFTPDIYSPYHIMLSPETVKDIQSKGMKVIPWTVNDVPTAKKLIDWGVDGIITDYPNMGE